MARKRRWPDITREFVPAATGRSSGKRMSHPGSCGHQRTSIIHDRQITLSESWTRQRTRTALPERTKGSCAADQCKPVVAKYAPVEIGREPELQEALDFGLPGVNQVRKIRAVEDPVFVF